MKEGVSKLAEELADETYRMVSNKLKSVDLLAKKIERLEGRLGRHVGDFKTDIVEVERMVTETKQDLVNEQDQTITILAGEIQELKDQVNALRIELNKIRSQRF